MANTTEVQQDALYRKREDERVTGQSPADGQKDPPQVTSHFTDVFEKELTTIKDRRKYVENEGRSEEKGAPSGDQIAEPSTRIIDPGLVGLAFSGGGIRSATFNLGVVQALAERGILKHVDYLSTVSGGGYIGSCLSTLFNDVAEYPYASATGDMKDPFPLAHRKGDEEPPALRHLRNSSNYLTGSGSLFEKMRLPALFLRGLLVNLLILFPYLALAVLLTQLILIWRGGDVQLFAVTRYFACGWLLLLVPYIFGSRWLLKLGWETRNRFELLYGISFFVVFAVALLELLPFLLSHYNDLQTGLGETMPSLTGAISALGALFGFLGTQGSGSEKSGVTGKLALYVVAIAGWLVFLLLYLQIGYAVIYSELGFIGAIFFYCVAFVVFIVTRIFVDVNATSFHSFYRDRLSKAYVFGVRKNKKGEQEIAHEDDLKLSNLNKSHAAPYHLINVTLNLQASDDPNLRGRDSDFFTLSKHYCGSERTGYVRTSRLEKIDPHLTLATAMAISAAAAAPNMGTAAPGPISHVLALLNIRLGYWLANPKKLLDKTGKETSSALLANFSRRARPIYLMREALNLVDDSKKLVNITDGGHLENLGVYELLRRRCKYIVCGDAEGDPDMQFGGLATLIRFAHIDLATDIEINLDDLRKDERGYSRRHCAIGTIKYPKGETGYLLYIKSSLTGDENAYVQEYRSKNPSFPHQTTADQFFDEAQFEAYRALGYKAAQTIFRADAATSDGMAQDEQEPEDREESVEDLFGRLHSKLLPRPGMSGQFVELQEQLSQLEESYGDPEIAAYSYHIYPEIAPEDGRNRDWSPEQKRRIFHFCNQQMQLMENVFLALRLDREFNRNHPMNRGWMNLFRRWVATERFLEAWGISIGTFSVSFGEFCKAAFGLRREIEWKSLELPEQQERLSEPERQVVKNYEGSKNRLYQAGLRVQLDSMQGMANFPVGLAVVKQESDMAELLYYRIRTQFRSMKLTDMMIQALQKKLKGEQLEGQQLKISITLDDNASIDRHRTFFRRYHYEVKIRPPN